MGNSKFEHIVATVHEMNGETVTADTQLEAFDRALEQESTSRRRAFDFNNDALSRVFPEFFEFCDFYFRIFVILCVYKYIYFTHCFVFRLYIQI